MVTRRRIPTCRRGRSRAALCPFGRTFFAARETSRGFCVPADTEGWVGNGRLPGGRRAASRAVRALRADQGRGGVGDDRARGRPLCAGLDGDDLPACCRGRSAVRFERGVYRTARAPAPAGRPWGEDPDRGDASERGRAAHAPGGARRCGSASGGVGRRPPGCARTGSRVGRGSPYGNVNGPWSSPACTTYRSPPRDQGCPAHQAAPAPRPISLGA